MQNSAIIKDEKIEPYFIKLVNSTYEVHQTHTPKESGKSEYTKFVAAHTNIRSAVISIVRRKLALKRRTKKTIALSEYLNEVKELHSVVESLLDDDSPERQIKLLKRRVEKLEEQIKKITLQFPSTTEPVFNL